MIVAARYRTLQFVCVTLTAAGLVSAVGCGGEPEAPPPAPSASSAVKLELDPTALIESPKVQFGIPMPVGAKPKVELPNYVVYYLPYSQERVANYLRARVDGNVDVGPKRTVFSDVSPHGNTEPVKLLIVVESAGFGSKLSMKTR